MSFANTQLNVVSLWPSFDGFIDFYGFHAGCGAWIFCGWIAYRWPDAATAHVEVRFQDGLIENACHAVFFARPDLREMGTGLIVFVPSVPDRNTGQVLQSLRITEGNRQFDLIPANADPALDSGDLTIRTGQLLAKAEPATGRDKAQQALSQLPYSGQDTTAALTDFVRVGIDHSFFLPPSGIALAGWLIAAPNAIRSVQLRSGQQSTPLGFAQSIIIDRPDVVDAFAAHGAFDRRCGFIAALPTAIAEDQTAFIEIETHHGQIAHVPIPPARESGLAAIRRLLGLTELHYGRVSHGFDHVFGPAVQALARQHLTTRPDIIPLAFGPPDPAPDCTLIIPLHGRIDFMESQCALFAADVHARHDIIYVLDDPAQADAAQHLAHSIWGRFRTPFRLLLLSRNMGYAPANNIALAEARAPHVCFLNSDVMPTAGPSWLRRLCTHLQTDPTLGAIGPILLFEDGSVQHQGMVFRPVARHGGWMFPQHIRKGLRPLTQISLETVEAITAACMVMRTEDARALGGFDEGFAIGDFEDADLCRRLGTRNLGCAIDHGVRLHHLERRSQESSSQLWRRNLTLYNSWRHQRRWFGTA